MTIEEIEARNVRRGDAIIERSEMGDYDPSLDDARADIDWLIAEVKLLGSVLTEAGITFERKPDGYRWRHGGME